MKKSVVHYIILADVINEPIKEESVQISAYFTRANYKLLEEIKRKQEKISPIFYTTSLSIFRGLPTLAILF